MEVLKLVEKQEIVPEGINVMLWTITASGLDDIMQGSDML